MITIIIIINIDNNDNNDNNIIILRYLTVQLEG